MALPKVYRVVQDAAGNVVPGVLGSVLLQGTGTLATLWQNDAGTIPLTNPMTSDATYGSFGFYIDPGHYDLTFSKPGYTFQSQLDFQVPEDALTLGTMAQQNAESVAITGGTATLSAITVTSITGGAATLSALNVDNPTLLVDPALNSVGFGTAPKAGAALIAASGEVLQTFIVDNPTLLVDPALNAVGFGVAPQPGFAVTATSMQVQGTLNVDNPTLLVDPALNAVGFGVAPTAGFAVSANSLHVPIGGSVVFDNPTFLLDPAMNGIGMGGAPLAGYTLNIIGVMRSSNGLVVGLPTTLPTDTFQSVWYLKNSHHGLTFAPTDNDTGPAGAIRFWNTGGAAVGGIVTTASATAYQTASDVRLKEDVQDLTGALGVVEALRPVAFRWKADGSPGRGFLAGEVQAVIPEGVITGEEGAVDEKGTIVPQMIDYSTLVPWLVGACKDLAAQVQALTARLEAVGG